MKPRDAFLQVSGRILGVALALAVSGLGLADDFKGPPKVPAKVSIEVAPERISAGDDARVTVRLEPIPGIKINRYPKIKLEVEGESGLVEPGKVAVGNDAPPPMNKMTTNYFETVDPLELTLTLAKDVGAGSHEVAAKLSYFYCMPANGFCAPKRVEVKIPIQVN